MSTTSSRPATPTSNADRRRLAAAVAVAALISTVTFLFVEFSPRSFLKQIELRTIDWRFAVRGPEAPTGDVVIVALDQDSMRQIGRWPWPRSILARLIEALNAGEPRAIVLDIAFYAPQDPTYLADGSKVDEDAALARAFARAKTLVSGYFLLFDSSGVARQGGITPEEAARRLEPSRMQSVMEDADGRGRQMLLQAATAEVNIEALTDAAPLSGYFNVVPDEDGVVRRQPLVVRLGDGIFESLEMTAVAAVSPNVAGGPTLALDADGARSLSLGRRIELDERGRLAINYRGPAGTFPHLSAAGVLDGSLDAAKWRDKLVLVGATAPAIGDTVSTPFQRQAYPGVEVHANVIDNLLRGDGLVRAPEHVAYDFLLMLVCIGVVGLVIVRARPVWSILAFAAAVVVIFSIVFYAFFHLRWLLGLVAPLTGVTVVFGVGIATRLVLEYRVRQRIKDAFAHYLPPEIVDRIAGDPTQVGLAGEIIEGTVLFGDIVGFTKISAEMDPARVVRMLNLVMSAVSEVIFKHGGTLDKFIGDAVMAIWGAPLPDPSHAEHACACALEIQEALDRVGEELRREGFDGVAMALGLSSGPMIAGDMGSTRRFDYTVVGAAVNAGQRVEALNRKLGTRILVAEKTRQLVGDESRRWRFVSHGRYRLFQNVGDEQEVFELVSTNSANTGQ
ncbi:MAG: adenylate/guanylate cyclase domain-containing protein [Deltaproteobacteria bacterium]|nr:adenylate/guanylate cyclase domain-containing protein [Deltaproteobacteria bacterium]